MGASFQNARQCLSSSNVEIWQHLYPPCVLAVQTSRTGPAACLPPSVLGNASSLPLSDLMWGNYRCHCLLGCAASALFWSFGHW